MAPLRFETARPDDLEAMLAEAPIAYVPLGTYEHHGWHLPVGFDGIKAHALCWRAALETGGVVLPTLFYGTGGGHVGYKWTVIVTEADLRPLLEATVDHLARFGFRVVVILTGHYAGEQVSLVRAIAAEAAARHAATSFIGLTEPDITTPVAGDRHPGDHAAKYETSIALALSPEWVDLVRLVPGRAPAQAALDVTPRLEGRQYEPADPLYAIWGEDPRTAASVELGASLVSEITDRLVERVRSALATSELAEPDG